MEISKSQARLFYLANELRSPLPDSLVKYIPQGEIIQAIASFGVSGVEQGLKLSRAQLEKLITDGRKGGKATRDEWKYLITSIITDELIERKDTMKLDDFMKKTDMLNRWLNGGASIITTEEGSFSSNPSEMIKKWDTGFGPFDTIFEGFYQGLFMIMGSTGTGKTSHMLSLAELLKKNKIADEIWFFQTEIPRRMFEYRMGPILTRAKFVEGKDRVFYGQQPLTEIIEMIKSKPNPNRIIFHDSPDVLASSAEEGRRFELEGLYRDLVIMKALCKAVFVGSQVRRKDRQVKVTSAAESWAKAWYSDGMIGLQKLGFKNQNAIMKAVVVKNRFGPTDFEIQYEYNQVQLTGHLTAKSKPRVAGWEQEEGEDDGDDW